MIFTGKINLKIAVLLWVFLNTGLVKADHCPSPETIKERKISRDYEWTIDERRTLDDVLAVEKLYSVRIKNQGEFIACYYSGLPYRSDQSGVCARVRASVCRLRYWLREEPHFHDFRR